MKSDLERPALAARSTSLASSASDRRRTTLFGLVFSGALRGSLRWSIGSMPSFLGKLSLGSRVWGIALDTWDCDTNGKQDHRPASQTGIQSREYPARNRERLNHQRISAPSERINLRTVATSPSHQSPDGCQCDYPRGRESTDRGERTEGTKRLTQQAPDREGRGTIGRGDRQRGSLSGLA
jgi:hypothetical protein